MAEVTIPCKSERQRERQPISVPFIWEERPGTPKRDWKPTAKPIKSALPPAKFVVSVPFQWEEKPGTPLSSFVPPPSQPAVPKYLNHGCHYDDEGENEEDDGSSDSEIDTYSVETDDSFTSAKSLLANGLISTTALSTAVPVEPDSFALTTTNDWQMHCPGSPASETDSTSSYATGTTSLVGVSFLEWLFPLLVPNSSVPNKVGRSEADPSQKADEHGKEFLTTTLILDLMDSRTS